MQIPRRELGDERAIEHARDGAILVELTLDLLGCVCNPRILGPSNERLHERASLSIVFGRFVSAKHTRGDRTLIEGA
jgi:hypothetical protein